MYVAMMSALLSVPFLILLEYVIMDILCRPTAASASSTVPSAAAARATKAAGDENILEGVVRANAELRKLVGAPGPPRKCACPREDRAGEIVGNDGIPAGFVFEVDSFALHTHH